MFSLRLDSSVFSSGGLMTYRAGSYMAFNAVPNPGVWVLADQRTFRIARFKLYQKCAFAGTARWRCGRLSSSVGDFFSWPPHRCRSSMSNADGRTIVRLCIPSLVLFSFCLFAVSLLSVAGTRNLLFRKLTRLEAIGLKLSLPCGLVF